METPAPRFQFFGSVKATKELWFLKEQGEAGTAKLDNRVWWVDKELTL